FATLSGDLVLPFNKAQSELVSLFRLTNTGNGAGSVAIEGVTNSTAGLANGVVGTVSSGSPGGFSAGVRGINNGTGGLGIGVYGSQNGSGWGVYGITPSGLGVYGATTTGTGVRGDATGAGGTGVYGTSNTGNAGRFEITNSANNTDALVASTNGGAASWAIRATSTGAQGAGIFTYNNAAGAANAVRVTNNGSGAGVFATASGTGNAGRFENTNAANTVPALSASTNGTAGNHFAIQGEISSASPGGFSAGVRGINNGTGGLGIGVWGSQAGSGWGVYGTANGGIGVNGSANSGIGVNGSSNTGTGGRFTTTTGLALHSTGGVRLEGIGEAANRVLTSDAAGNATWQALGGGVGIGGSGTLNFVSKWTPNGTNLGNSLLFDNGSSVGLGTTTPTHRLDVTHAGSTGIGVNSTSGFSVVDINAASGDAALRFGNAGVNQWNIRNQPGTDNLQIFELGGGGERMSIQNSTGNVAIGGSSGAYRLDILHGGSTGILNKSSSSFSVLDIDAFTGDAAIRLANNGVNQWNIRNQPGTDNLQIFELGGGGERMSIQNSTGNVAIGGSSGAYRLDILHGGSTGILNKSSSSFSVLDIDAFTGDAAIRLANNGVNQWNIRNQPGTDNLQIFELGGGGERMSIQNSTGNIAIGGSSGAYKLDILHGGSTGILNKSSSSFSVLDIDAFTGDAAIRLANNGVNQWNIRNQPGTNNLQIFELGGGGERMRIDNGTGLVVISGGLTVLGAPKLFTMDHPLDPENKTLKHASAESNEVINFYSGNVVTDANGKAVVKLPDYFEAINKDPRYQLTVIGAFAQAIISKKVQNNQFEIATSIPNVEVSWEVKAVRNDRRMQLSPFTDVVDKSAAQKGKYWDPAAYNLPESRNISYDAASADKSGSSLNYVAPPTNKQAVVETGGSLTESPKSTGTAKTGDNTTGSVSEESNKPRPAAKTAPADNSGSVEEKPKAELKKPVQERSGSVEDSPKPVEERKTPAAVTGTRTE
ncbi:MAG: hypothetical protein JNM88_08645, partial [Chitinophagaceae bacterium]|nr:hypothetical protein [Chitinophagaceae bacterium]